MTLAFYEPDEDPCGFCPYGEFNNCCLDEEYLIDEY